MSQLEIRATFLIRLAKTLRRDAKPSILINGRYR